MDIMDCGTADGNISGTVGQCWGKIACGCGAGT